MSRLVAKVKWHSRVYSNTTVRLIPLQHVPRNRGGPSWVKGGDTSTISPPIRFIPAISRKMMAACPELSPPKRASPYRGQRQDPNNQYQMSDMWVIPKDPLIFCAISLGLFHALHGRQSHETPCPNHYACECPLGRIVMDQPILFSRPYTSWFHDQCGRNHHQATCRNGHQIAKQKRCAKLFGIGLKNGKRDVMIPTQGDG